MSLLHVSAAPARRTFFAFIMLTLAGCIISHAHAGYSEAAVGVVTVTEDVAPIREDYPDGRILDVVPRGTQFTISSASGDGRGKWIIVDYERKDRHIRGFVDARLTSFEDDFKSGKLGSGEQHNSDQASPDSQSDGR